MTNAVKYAGAAAAVLAALTFGLVVLAGGAGSSAASEGAVAASVLGQLAAEECVATGPLPTLDAAQAANAETIVAAADALGAGARGAQIALMTAYTESGLEDLGAEPDNDGSLGLFQQRAAAGWGTPAEEVDPTDATGLFIEHLLAVPGWTALPPWVAAQDVQRSAFSNGSNYEAHWALAGQLLATITARSATARCGQGTGAEPAGPASRFGLPVGYTIPATATSAETLVVTYALSKLGDPYVYAAAGPDAFDCSGLTMMAWAQAGIALDHYTGDQLTEGSAVPGYSAISPGDLVLIPGSDGTLAAPGHVGLYLGYGLVESAVDPQQGVIVQTWANFTGGGLSGIRHLG